jgi:hypothetical protein
MATSTQTPNYALSQYASNDPVKFLTNYNDDMGKIDTGVKAAQVVAANASNSNLLINGDFQVNQRGTSFSNLTSLYTSDRWMSYATGDGGTLPNVTHLTNLNDTIISDDTVCKFYRMNFDGSGVNLGTGWQVGIRHLIDSGTRKYCGTGKKLTLSFYARSNILNKKMSVGYYQSYGTGGSPSANEYSVPTSFSLSSSWQRFSYTIDTYTLDGKTFGTNSNDLIGILIRVGWGTTSVSGWPTSEPLSAGYVDIAKVKLEPGSVTTPFVPRLYAEELAYCQRYFRIIGGIFSAFFDSSSVIRVQVPLAFPMRTIATLSGGLISFIMYGSAYLTPTVTSMALNSYLNELGYDVKFITTTTTFDVNIRPVLCSVSGLQFDAEIY